MGIVVGSISIAGYIDVRSGKKLLYLVGLRVLDIYYL